MRFSRVLSRASLRSRAIRHRIIRRQVRCGPRQLGKLEGVVFYFRNVQRALAPRGSLIFAPPRRRLFCVRFLREQSFPAALQSSFVNAPAEKFDDKWPVRASPLCSLSISLFFSHTSGCRYRNRGEHYPSSFSQRIKIEIEARERSEERKRIMKEPLATDRLWINSINRKLSQSTGGSVRQIIRSISDIYTSRR